LDRVIEGAGWADRFLRYHGICFLSYRLLALDAAGSRDTDLAKPLTGSANNFASLLSDIPRQARDGKPHSQEC
jgi:hypothetical protein